MQITILDTYYAKFLSDHYNNYSELSVSDYSEQKQSLLDQDFGTSDSYSHYLTELGHEVDDLIANCHPLQKQWLKEEGENFQGKIFNSSRRFSQFPLIGNWLSQLPHLSDIAVKQVKAQKPDVLYCQDLWFLTPKQLNELRDYTKLIVGQTASPLPHIRCLKQYDLILSSFPHFIPRLREMGIAAEYFKIGFDERILNKLTKVERDIDFSFVGGITRHHKKAFNTLEQLAIKTPIKIFGYGAKRVSKKSPIISKHQGEVWGIDMFKVLARSKITFNRHIDVAENYANNMRLFEATGAGALLITDAKQNLDKLFDLEKEIVTYSNIPEAIEKINYYISQPMEAAKIAKAGQARTLKDHTYSNRMVELSSILENYIRKEKRNG